METVYIILKSGKTWTNLFFTSEESVRNYLKMRVPKSHALREEEHNKFVSKRYGSQYLIIELKNHSTEQKRISEEFMDKHIIE